MKKLYLFLFVATCFVTGNSQNYNYDVDGDGAVTIADVTAIYDYLLGKDGHEWVDLGLPSGTLWKESNEDDNNFYTWQQAKNKYNNSLPSHKQMEELRSHCRFVNIGNNVKVIGPNGKYIILQNTGYRRSDGTITNTNYCCCWSSSSETNSNKAWSLSILGKGIVVIGVADKDEARPIRLIRSK